MDFASIQDLEIRDFVLIVNSKNFIQKKMGIKILTKFCNSQKHSILSLGLIEYTSFTLPPPQKKG